MRPAAPSPRGSRRSSRFAAVALFALLLTPLSAAQYPPDLGPVGEVVDEIGGQVVPPTLNTTYALLGQNLTREDVRLFLDLNITTADVNPIGLLVGSGHVEVEADIGLRAEFRVLSTERIKEAVFGGNPYNISAENVTFLSEVYLPADLFRLTLTAEAIALFEEEQERALFDMVREMVPELDILDLSLEWRNTSPLDALTDLTLSEPPIIADLQAKVRFLRVESIPSLLSSYLGTRDLPEDPRQRYAQQLKADHGDLLRTRDFFAAAAYTQLLNLSMQPGWSLEGHLRVPQGFTFEYFNDELEVSEDRRSATFTVDATSSDNDVQDVLLASLTQRRAVALALFGAMWFVSLLIVALPRGLYVRFRLPRLLVDPADDEPADERPPTDPPT
ncbi:MAG: hypothetical protein ACPGQL_10160 [Thermoplasmatota archaeon]